MRKPKIHLGFNVETCGDGLLIGKDNPEIALTRSSLPNLGFITAGPIPPTPSELILNQKMSDLIVPHLKTMYTTS